MSALDAFYSLKPLYLASLVLFVLGKLMGLATGILMMVPALYWVAVVHLGLYILFIIASVVCALVGRSRYQG
jgi:hypothetical protein